MRILTQPAELLNAIPDHSPFGARDHALIRLDLNVGLRVSELHGLDIGDVWVPRKGPRDWLDVRWQIAKGSKARQIPLSSGAKQAVYDLVHFLHMRGFQTEPDCPLLQDRRHRRLPVREIQRLVQKYREAANLDIRVTPHTLRHTWCSRICRKHSPRVVQQLAGHDQLTSTEIYLHNQPDDLVAAVETGGDFRYS